MNYGAFSSAVTAVVNIKKKQMSKVQKPKFK